MYTTRPTVHNTTHNNSYDNVPSYLDIHQVLKWVSGYPFRAPLARHMTKIAVAIFHTY